MAAKAKANKSKQKNIHTPQKQTNKLLTVENIIFAILMFIIFIAPYFRGLFFRENYLAVNLICTVLLLALLIKHLAYKDVTIPNRPIDLLMWGLPLAYLLAFFVAVDPGMARDELLRNINYVVIYYILLMTIKTKAHLQIVLASIVATAVWVALFGYGVGMGTWEFNAALSGTRIQSVFQYANTLGAFLGGAILIALVQALNSDQSKEGNVGIKKNSAFTALYLAAATVLFSVFLLSYSRGAWLVFAVVYIIALIIIPLKDKLVYLVYTAIIVVPSLFVVIKANPVIKAVNAVNSGQQDVVIPSGGWLALVAAVAAAAVAAFAYSWLHNSSKADRKKFLITQGATALLIVISLVAIVPQAVNFLGSEQSPVQTIVTRAETILSFEEDRSASTRFAFYQDALKIYQDYPILGAGGGAWRALFEKYQSYNYWSTQAHTYYLQLAVETGTVGIIALIAIITAFLVAAIYLLRKTRGTPSNYLIMASILAFIMLMGHNFIDFNMSLSAYAMVIWVLMAVIAGQLLLHSKDNALQRANNKNVAHANANKPNPIIALLTKPVIKENIFGIILTSVTVILLFANAMPVMAHNQAKHVPLALQQKNYQLALDKLASAHSLDPLDASTTISYAEFLNNIAALYKDENARKQQQAEAIAIMQKLTKDVPYSPNVRVKMAELYAKSGNAEAALKELDTAISLAPFNDDVYNQRIILGCQYAETLLKENKDTELAAANLKQVLNYYQKMQQTIKELEERGIKSTNRPFETNNQALLAVAKANYLAGNYKLAAEQLLQISKDKNLQSEAAAWLAAAYQRQGDTNNYQKWQADAVKLDKANEEKINNIIALPNVEL